MGAPKLLLPLGGRPVIRHVVDELLSSPVDGVVVVVGSHADQIADALNGLPVQLVVNPEPAGDMLGSVRCGLRAMPAACGAALIVLGDQPGISRAVVVQLLQAYRAGRGKIVVPVFAGRRGHPLLLAAEYRVEILQQHGEVGLRGLLQAHPQEVCEVPVASPEILEDMDLPEDYQRIARNWQ